MTTDRVARILEGAVDLHVHPAPSPLPRRIGAAEAARLAGEAGFRAIVVKSHHHSTVTDVLALQAEGAIPSDVHVFGGVALNGAVGGINPKAVDLALKLGGKIVWFPTIGSPKHIRHHAEHPDLKFPKLAVQLKPEEPIEILADGEGRVRDEVYAVLESVKEADAILASGHLAPDRITALFRAAREVGVERLLVNHPNFVVEASPEDGKRWVELGAYIEHSLCMYDEESSFYQWDVETLVAWIEAIGPARSILGSDLGQMDNPLPTESFRKIVAKLLDRGVREDDVRRLVGSNAAQLLGVA
ncbi:MAG: DUF6282 family protein [Actinomycetota bacterium]|nr:DUF6282 family protein [Actinomycetota bacterium]